MVVAEKQLAEARSPHERAVAGRALGIALRVLGRVADSVTVLQQARRDAQSSGDPDLQALTEMTLAVTTLYLGNTDGAFALFDSALAKAHGLTRALVASERAGALLRLGRFDEGLLVYDDVLPTLLASADPTDAADLLANRAICRSYQGHYDLAILDTERALRRYVDAGALIPAAIMKHNLGYFEGRRGNIVRSLALFEEAAIEARRVGALRSTPAADRCEVLLAAGLRREALEVALERAEWCREGKQAIELAEVLLLASKSALALDDTSLAERTAAEAVELFDIQARPGWRAHATIAAARARLEAGHGDEALVTTLLEHASRLAASDARSATEAQCVALIAAARINAPELAREIASNIPADLPVDLEVLRRLALAELSAGVDHDDEAVEHHVQAAWSTVEAHRTALASTELRAHAGHLMADLAALDLRRAKSSRSPERVHRATERARVQALQFQRLRPSDDSEIARLLAELRTVISDQATAGRELQASTALDGRRLELERAVATRARLEMTPIERAITPVSLDELRSQLGDELYVSLHVVADELSALVVSTSHQELIQLGSVSSFESGGERIRRACVRLARGLVNDALRDQAHRQLASETVRLDSVLAPLFVRGRHSSIVLNPTPVLHGFPWRRLTEFAARPTTIVSSAANWLRVRDRSPRALRRVCSIAGPDLVHAPSEAAVVASLYPRADCLTGPSATCVDVLECLRHADVAHLVCHGRFRPENPMLTSLRMVDGELTAYDLERLPSLPGLIVLSACDVGSSSVAASDELLGFAHVLLGLGVRHVVASSLPVPDGAATVGFMRALHHRLVRGDDPAAALASTSGDDVDPFLSGLFVVLGG